MKTAVPDIFGVFLLKICLIFVVYYAILFSE